MKKLTASEARDLTELAGLAPHYIDIKDAAESGLKNVDVTYLTKDEFDDLINDGYRISNIDETEVYTKWFKELETGEDDILISWEV